MAETEDAAIPPEQEGPDRRALELASMCDLVESGAATSVSVTFTRSSDEPDIAILAEQITAGRGLVASIESGPDTVTVHIRAREEEVTRGRPPRAGPHGSPVRPHLGTRRAE